MTALQQPSPVKPANTRRKQKQSQRTVGRQLRPVLLLFAVTGLLLGGLGSRLAYLQLAKGDRNRQLAENNRIRILPKLPVRGLLLDRKGRIIADSRLSHSLFIWPLAQTSERWPETVQLLAEILEIPTEEIQTKVEQAEPNSPTLVRIARNLTPAQITAIEEYSIDLDGVEIDAEPIRSYPHGTLAAHVVGYTGEITSEELDALRERGYRLGDVIGRMGVERGFESQLRGEWGGQQVEVDGSGRIVRILGEKQARAGLNISLTLDLDVQRAAEAALDDRRGAIVAIDPHSGGILAMVSHPTFDPNIFSTRITHETWEALQSQGNPFINRAVRGYPPGSTFKVVTAIAGMESGKYPPGTILNTYGVINLGGMLMPAWNGAGFGPLGYEGALQWSSNTFFGQVAVGVGGVTLIDWSRRLGFGVSTGVELAEESSGLIADDEWKRERFNDWGWTIGDTANMSIGQGFTLTTPLQVAVLFAIPANGGYLVRAHFLKDERPADAWRKSLDLNSANVATVQRGLRQVVTAGTGQALAVPHLPPTAGKSGTAEAPPGETHAWFGAYAPYDKPEIVVVAFAEHSGGGGGSVAAPMVREVLETYFDVKPPQ
ncbi:penicillin-binding protein 2 [Rubidibacter lacunae KORDI 51-2]|uniref:Beta-lactamase n=1 Tax=Rubidibacter lacunae KORDI 51-2 TaxID=582515 RepID=U5DMX6_9CHRO|nr:penicillin-binding protein 2 [Rubidibacter lacunae]ERN42197.1 penicillin-binding protein 2 [Rubidibacter lacunae KORDI 51-2]